MVEEKCGGSFQEVYKTAIGFARMWGVMETLKPLPCLEFSEVFDMVTEWAKEYTGCGREDPVEFFQEKVIFAAGRDCMPNAYDFEITDDRRSRDDKILKMRLENPYYEVKVYYMDCFEADRNSGGLDPHFLSISVKPKKGIIIWFTYNLGGSCLENVSLESVPIDKVLDMFEPIKIAVESEKALRAKLDVVLSPLRPW